MSLATRIEQVEWSMTADALPGVASGVAAPNHDVAEELSRHLALGTTPIFVRSPPGAGKTALVAMAAAITVRGGLKVCVVTATNNQAGEVASRVAAGFPDVTCVLLLGTSTTIPRGALVASTSGQVVVARKFDEIPSGPAVVVSCGAKWMCHPHVSEPPYDLMILEEAYMQPWHATFPLANLAGRHLAVGDPGQTEPFAQSGDLRWRGQERSPLSSAGEALSRLHPGAPVLQLGVSLRLPDDTCRVLQPLYTGLTFTGLAVSGQRVLAAPSTPEASAQEFLSRLAGRSIATWARPAPVSLDPLDPDTCRQAGRLATALADAALTTQDLSDDEGAKRASIAVVCARTQQVAVVRSALRGRPAAAVVVDTANRLQGLEYDIVLAVDPLTGHRRLGAFELEPGRLSVMLSRHRTACLLLTTTGVDSMLARHVPTSDRALGRDPDLEHHGWQAHTSVRAALVAADEVARERPRS